MNRKSVLVVGSGGRENAIIAKLAETSIVHAFMSHANPGIIKACEETGGQHTIGNTTSPQEVADFAQKCAPSLALVSNDNSLAAGIVDALRALDIATFGATQLGAKIEWSKQYALEVLDAVAPEYNIKTFNARNMADLEAALAHYPDEKFVVKPDGLTGGKGVKVGGFHFASHAEGANYAKECLEASGNVILQEIIQGREFTVMGFTDGKCLQLMPITFDYPYRFDGNTGPGTGGMGVFSYPNGLLPFLTQADLDECKDVLEKVIAHVNADSKEYNGVIYGGFFKTQSGIKVIEFNSRFGDPECLNVMGLLDSPLIDIVEACAKGGLSADLCRFRPEASLAVYLVAPKYAIEADAPAAHFTIDQRAIEGSGAKVIYASCRAAENGENGENHLVSIGNSRLAAIVTSGDLEEIRSKTYGLIAEHTSGEVDYRREIGDIACI